MSELNAQSMVLLVSYKFHALLTHAGKIKIKKKKNKEKEKREES